MSGGLKNRGYFNTIVDNGIIKKVRKLSKDTKIPISRLADEAWLMLLTKYQKEKELTDDN